MTFRSLDEVSLRRLSLCRFALGAATLLLPFSWGTVAAAAQEEASPEPISYFRQIRPLFQEHCHGCHQPAKQSGGYVMTEFDRLIGSGESGSSAIVPSDPAGSHLIAQITPHDGVAAMPAGLPALADADRELIRSWIAAGAVDDTPASNRVAFDDAHPPTYQAAPVVTALAFAPDGSWLAVSGYHEVLLFPVSRSEGTAHSIVEPQATRRLIGMSERIESLRFSPDGTRLAVAGGSPGRFGEIQIWELTTGALLLSKLVGYDTLYGVSWSPDGTLVAFGCPDNTIRGIDPVSGEQKLFNGAHDDWVLDTVFSTAGDHLISVSRDRSMKLVNVPTQRFIDNITSITPGALKGGLAAVDRHPTQDQLLCGGADGIPKLYKMVREMQRRIGDDFNLIRAFAPIEGRISDVTFDRSGDRIAVCSSLDGRGHWRIASTADAATLVDVAVPESGLYAIDFSSDGSLVVTAGFDGQIRVYLAVDGSELVEFSALPPEGIRSAATSP